MMIEKLNYSETTYPERVEKLCTILEEKLDHVTLEYVKELAEVCYKEGYKDGYRFSDWLHERTR